MQILFSDEKPCDVDGVYNVQNDRVWIPSRAEASKSSEIKAKRKFPQKFMVWLGARLKRIIPLVVFEEDTLDHGRYIKEVLLPVALR